MSASMQFSDFRHHKFLNLETFRRNGAGVPTPVWFLLDDDRLYVRTPAQTGKVKRVRNIGRARVAPCDRAGNLLGSWQEVNASLVKDETTLARVNQLLNRKYGLLKRVVDFFSDLRKTRSEVILLEKRE
jgi:PPOX class probable F420-dependent enzyme